MGSFKIFFERYNNYCKHGSFLDDIDQFDPLFFNISGLEATYMDPQQRFFLEESWKALEDAGYAGTGISRKPLRSICGMFRKVIISSYLGIISTRRKHFGVMPLP